MQWPVWNQILYMDELVIMLYLKTHMVQVCGTQQRVGCLLIWLESVAIILSELLYLYTVGKGRTVFTLSVTYNIATWYFLLYTKLSNLAKWWTVA